MPLSVLQAVEANQAQGIKRIYSRIAEPLQCTVPAGQLDALQRDILTFEQQYEPATEPAAGNQSRYEGAWRRMKEALSDSSHKWRTLDRIAIVGGVSEDEALEILGQHRSVVFGKGKKTKKRIVRLATNVA